MEARTQHTESSQTELFVRLFSAYSSRLQVYIRTLVLNPTDSDEVFQNTSCVLWRKFDTFDPSSNFMHWACRIAYLEVCNFRRIKRRQPILNEPALELVAADAERLADQDDWRRVALDKCLKRLDGAQSKLLHLRYEQQQKPKEISRHFGQSIHTIYRRLARIYDDLLQCINAQVDG